MDVRLAPEQRALRDSAAQVAGRHGPSTVGELDDPERAAKLDAAIAAAGWRELRTPTDDGGPWASGVEVAIVAEELGRGRADAGFLGVNYERELGFTGIAVAFLGRNHPVGVPLAAIMLGLLFRGEDGIAIATDLPREIVIILEGLLILSVVVAYELVRRWLVRRQQRTVRAEEGADSAAA